jgi:hypothetical protein
MNRGQQNASNVDIMQTATTNDVCIDAKDDVLDKNVRSGPPGSGPARDPGRAGTPVKREAGDSTRRIGGSGRPSLSGDTPSTNLPGSSTLPGGV